MTEAEILLEQVREACRTLGIAQTTFGRLAVNDGKLVNRLEQGGRVTAHTIARVHRFIESKGAAPATGLRSALRGPDPLHPPEHDFRFYDNRQKYLMFVSTTSEKQVIADRALEELARTNPRPPAIRIFDGGAGDGTALARLLRGMHRSYLWSPFYVVAKEISMENVRLTLDKMHERFQEHPATILAITNLRYRDAPWLQASANGPPMTWHEVALKGSSAGDFEEQIAALTPWLRQNWQAGISARSGNPVYRRPAVLLLYREDQRFLLDPMLPQRGRARADFDLVLLSHAYRAQGPLGFKARRVVAPLVRALGRGGRLVGVQGAGGDPGMEIIREIWPDEHPFIHDRRALMRAVQKELGGAARSFRFHALPDARAIFRFAIHTQDAETDPGEGDIGISTLFGAWVAATYVAQIDDKRLADATSSDAYLDATRAALQRHRGLWFNDEMYVISRRDDLL
jgi:hypothetical protein